MKYLIILALIAVAIACPTNYLWEYSDPIIVDIPTNITKVVYNSCRSNILVASGNQVLYYSMNGTLEDQITYPHHVEYISVNTRCAMAVLTHNDEHDHHNVYIYKFNVLYNNITLPKGFYAPQLNNYEDIFAVSRGEVYSTNHTNITGTTVIEYYDFNGKFITNFTVSWLVWDMIVDPITGNLIFDSFMLLEPAVYIGEANTNGLIATINTTRDYPSSGLTVNQWYLAAGGYGLSIYHRNGTLFKQLFKHMNIQNPQFYQSMIVYQTMSYPFASIQFTTFYGTIVASIPVYYDTLGYTIISDGTLIIYEKNIMEIRTLTQNMIFDGLAY